MTILWLVIIAIQGALLIPTENNAALRSHYCARSIEDLQELVKVDFEIMKRLKLLNDDPSTPSALSDVIQSYMEDFFDSSFVNNLVDESELVRHIDETMENPIAILRLVQRVILFLQEIAPIPGHSLRLGLGRFSNVSQLEQDLDEVAAGLERIHSFYSLNVSEFARGKIGNVETGIELYGSDCFLIGGIALRDKAYASAMQWLLEAYRRAEEDQTVDPVDLEVTYRHAVKKHDEEWLTSTNDNIHKFFTSSVGSFELTTRLPTFQEKLQADYNDGNSIDQRPEVVVQKLCSRRNSPLVTPSQLFCWFEHHIHSSFKIGPLKMEFLSQSPDIVQIHEAFSPKEMESLIYDASGHMKPTLSSENSEHYVRAGQSMAEVFLGPKNGRSGSPKVNEKIQAMIGLFSSGSCKGCFRNNDHLWVTSQLPGGYTEPHTACGEHEDQNCLDRLATFMVYLNDVKEGGSTVFPKASTVSKPRKGSALFWFNSLSDCTRPDDSTEHASCPVLLGQKWTATKWIATPHFLHQKCWLSQDESYQFPANGKYRRSQLKGKHQKTVKADPKLMVSGNQGEYFREPVPITRKFSYYSVSGLEELIGLERRISAETTTETGLVLDRERAKVSEQRELPFNEASGATATAGPADGGSLSNRTMNPLTVFHAIWRFEHVGQWAMASPPEQSSHAATAFGGNLRQLPDPRDGPTIEDVRSAAIGLLRTQFVYGFRTEDVAQGLLDGTDTGVKLNSAQCIELAQRASYHDYHTLSVEWAQEALRRVNNGPEAKLSASFAEKEVIIAERMLELHKNKAGTFDEVLDKRYRQICQGTVAQSEEEKRKLFCWLETQIHPTWTIAPLKAEWLSLTPQVVQYHDILTDGLIERLQQDRQYVKGASSKFHRGFVVEPNIKLSAVSWMNAAGGLAESETARLFWNLLGRVTGERARRSLQVQLAAYAPGGHYRIHDDVRGSTFVAYLQEPERGGETVMLHAGVRVPPKKGSAVYWHNVDSSGVRDMQTLHGSCPIIFGVKQIATGWPSYYRQSHQVCRKEWNREIEILVNGRSVYETKPRLLN